MHSAARFRNGVSLHRAHSGSPPAQKRLGPTLRQPIKCARPSRNVSSLSTSRPEGPSPRCLLATPAEHTPLTPGIPLSAVPVVFCYMSKGQIDKYLASLEQPKRGTLEALRRTILDIVPEAEQCISYGMPAFRVQGKVIAGFAAFKNHLSYLPHSGSVFPELGEALSKYKASTGALQFPVDRLLPKALVKKLIAIRMKQALGVSEK